MKVYRGYLGMIVVFIGVVLLSGNRGSGIEGLVRNGNYSSACVKAGEGWVGYRQDITLCIKYFDDGRKILNVSTMESRGILSILMKPFLGRNEVRINSFSMRVARARVLTPRDELVILREEASFEDSSTLSSALKKEITLEEAGKLRKLFQEPEVKIEVIAAASSRLGTLIKEGRYEGNIGGISGMMEILDLIEKKEG